MKRERAAPHPKVPEPIWHFSTQGLPANYIAVNSRELLPHVFTLSPKLEWLFSVALSVSEKNRNPAIHRCAALSCPDFPRCLHNAIACYGLSKLIKISVAPYP